MRFLKKLTSLISADGKTSAKQSKKGVELMFNGDFYYLENRLNDGNLILVDINRKGLFLMFNVSNKVLGEKVIETLASCRDLIYGSEYSDFVTYMKKVKTASAELERKFREAANDIKKYKNQTELYQSMISVSIVLDNDEIIIDPSSHNGLKDWGGLLGAEMEPVMISATSSPEELGKAVRIALSRCPNPYGEKKGLPEHNFDAFLK